MGSESQVTVTQSKPTVDDSPNNLAIGAKSASSALAAPRSPKPSALVGGGEHRAIPLIPNAGSAALDARDALIALDHDPERRVMMIKRILDIVEVSNVEIALQLLGVVQAFADLPAVADAVRTAHAKVEHRAAGHALKDKGATDARAYNAANPQNVTAFIAATGDLCTNHGALDVGRVADWQASRGLAADGKIGPATLKAAEKQKQPDGKDAEHAADAKKTNGFAFAGTTTTQQTTTQTGNGQANQSAPGDLEAIHREQRAKFDAEDAALNDPLYKHTHQTRVTPVDVYRGISQCGTQPHVFKVLMTAHSTGEQDHECPDNNFMGFEFNIAAPFGKAPPHIPWTRALRSDKITIAQYRANPTYYYDSSAYGKTIEHQLKTPGVTHLYVLWYGPRYRFETVQAATASFYGGIVGWRLSAFQKSKHQEHRDTATAALGGDVEAYITLVTTSDTELKVQAYNGDTMYPGIIRPLLTKAKTDPKFNGLDP